MQRALFWRARFMHCYYRRVYQAAQLQIEMQLVSSPSSRRVWLVLSLSLSLIAVMGGLLTQSLRTLNEGSRWVAHSERVRYQLVKILQTLSDLGNGVTSYQLTHDASLFAPAEAAASSLQSELKELDVLTGWDDVQAPLLAHLRQLAQQRETETHELRAQALNGDVMGVQATLAAGRHGEADGGREALTERSGRDLDAGRAGGHIRHVVEPFMPPLRRIFCIRSTFAFAGCTEPAGGKARTRQKAGELP